MNKHIPTAAAALALVCAMGFSYAQSTQEPSDASTTPATQTDPASPAAQDNAVPPPDAPASSATTTDTTQAMPSDSMSTNSTPANDSTMPSTDTSTQRAPQADRN
ncbi:hypothetical protein ACFJGW_19990 [Burkholderiaceae bacterium UC74_6]